jgi:hypothetical protein
MGMRSEGEQWEKQQRQEDRVNGTRMRERMTVRMLSQYSATTGLSFISNQTAKCVVAGWGKKNTNCIY